MSTSAITRTETINGWLVVIGPDGIPRIRDVDAAARLSLTVKDWRRAVRACASRGFIAENEFCTNLVQNPAGTGRPLKEYLHVEPQVYIVASQTRSPLAPALVREMADVFTAYRNGHLAPTALTLDTATVSSARIRDNPAAMATLRRAIKRIVLATGCTTQRVYGLIRKTEKPSSAFDLSVLRLEPLVRWLEQIESGAVALLSRREVKAIAAGKKAAAEQMNLRFNDGETH